MKTLTILFIVTSHSMMGDTEKPTGLWMEELTTPYYTFQAAGFNVEIASIAGGSVPIDPRSKKDLGENPVSVDRFLRDTSAMRMIERTPSIKGLDTSQLAAIFLPGGHGTMWDFPQSETLASIVTDTLDDGRIVAAVCHGPAGLVAAVTANNEPVVKGRKIAAFTDSEEEAVGLTDAVPFLLESRLRELGAEIHKTDDFQPFAIADGNLITGQNPGSSKRVAELVIKTIQEIERITK